ncbi:MAG TPA: hypothetical protein PKD17_10495 [Cellvibrionaceae bacterium]|nr:hypothetical protein [Cellvibrionaceae bacterium]
MEPVQPSEREQEAKTLTAVIYALYAASFLVGISALVAIVINYVKQNEVNGTFLESHFRWQIRTFWFGLLWGIIGGITSLILIGWLVLLANAVWIIYRLVIGWTNLNNNKPMY